MEMIKIIEKKLRSHLTIYHFDIQDDSSSHKTHQGYKPGGETHFTINITAQEFSNLNRVAQHKLIYSILKDELNNTIHALALHTKKP